MTYRDVAGHDRLVQGVPPHDHSAGDISGDADITVRGVDVLTLPKGRLASAEVTSDQGGITSQTDLTGLSVTVNVAANRRLRISMNARFACDTVPARLICRIMEETTQLQQAILNIQQTGANGQGTLSAWTIEEPSSGSHTYKLTAETNSGTATLEAGPSGAAFLLVEDLGPA